MHQTEKYTKSKY